MGASVRREDRTTTAHDGRVGGRREEWRDGRRRGAGGVRRPLYGEGEVIERHLHVALVVGDAQREYERARIRHVEAGHVSALPVSCFPLEEGAVQAAFRVLQRGLNVGKVVVRVSNMLRLTGHIAARDALDLLRQLPEAKPVLIEMRELCMDGDDDLIEFLRQWRGVLVLLCKGEISGRGAFLLMDAAQLAVGDTTCTLAIPLPDATMQPNRRLVGCSAGCYPADAALRRGWLDAVCHVTEAPSLVQQAASPAHSDQPVSQLK